MHDEPRIADLVEAVALEGCTGPAKTAFRSRRPYAALRAAGTEVWLDTGDRAAAEAVWGAEVSGLTTNNTLVNQVIQTGALDGTIKGAAKRLRDAVPGISAADLVFETAFTANARVALDLVRTFGVKVSVELHPAVADDVEATIALARRYFEICPERFLIKVPLTAAGYIAVRKLSFAGVPVNFTLGFSARQNLLAAAFSRPGYVNLFLGRLNQVVLESKLGDGRNVGEKATLASQRGVREWRDSDPTCPTLQIAASLRSEDQVIALAGVDVQTIPPKVAGQFLAMRTSSLTPDMGRELPVQPAEGLDTLWEITDGFRAFVEQAAALGDEIRSPEHLRELAARHGVNDFLRDWTPQERAEIRAGGKIPKLSRWQGVSGLDDLMTMAALESFGADQAELDQRIAALIR